MVIRIAVILLESGDTTLLASLYLEGFSVYKLERIAKHFFQSKFEVVTVKGKGENVKSEILDLQQRGEIK